MLLVVFSIYDSGVKAWRQPMVARSTGEILRWWIDACNNPQSDFSKHPSDYKIFEMGTFDDVTGEFHISKAPVSLGMAQDFIKAPPVSE